MSSYGTKSQGHWGSQGDSHKKHLLQHTQATNQDRADQLEEFVEHIHNEFGVKPKLMPRKKDTYKAPAIKGYCKLDSTRARNLLVSADEAIRQFRNGEETGFYIYAGREDHNTESLGVMDQDDSTYFIDNLPKTLTITSGSGGDSRHLPFRNDPDDPISNAKAGNHGSIIAQNQGVMVPGSIHPTGGVYHISGHHEITTFSDSDLTEEMRPVSPSGDGTHREGYSWSHNTDPDPIIAKEGSEYIHGQFSRESGDYASSALEQALRGEEPDGCRFRRDGDDQWNEIDRSELDFYTLSKLYGAFLHRFGTSSTEEARKYAIETFKLACQDHERNQSNDRRKWFSLGDVYLHNTMDSVQNSFDMGVWRKWRRKEYKDGFDLDKHRPWLDDEKDGVPSAKHQDVARAVVRMLSTDDSFDDVLEMYGLDSSVSLAKQQFASINTRGGGELIASPDGDSGGEFTADRFSKLCHAINPRGKISYYDWILKKWLQARHGEVKMAYCESRENGKRWVYYPKDHENPEDATEVTVRGETYEPGEEEWIDHSVHGSYAAKQKDDIDPDEYDEYKISLDTADTRQTNDNSEQNESVPDSGGEDEPATDGDVVEIREEIIVFETDGGTDDRPRRERTEHEAILDEIGCGHPEVKMM